MLLFNTTHDAVKATVNIMENLWHKRRFLQRKAYFVFRIEAENWKTPSNTSVYAHFLIEGDRWFFMMSDGPYNVSYKEITKRMEQEESWTARRVESWRHYALNDLVQVHLGQQLEEQIAADMSGEAEQIAIWDAFPAQDIY